MFFAGHMILAYFCNQLIVRKNISYSLPLLFVASIVPDLDFIIAPVFQHHTITHSVLFWPFIYGPLLAIFRLKVIPYLLATYSHFLIGDLVTGNPPLLYGISDQTFGTIRPWIDITFGSQYGVFYQGMIDVLMIIGLLATVIIRKKHAFPTLVARQRDMLFLSALVIVIFAIFAGAYKYDIVYMLQTDKVQMQSSYFLYAAYAVVAISNAMFALILLKGTLHRLQREAPIT